MRIAIVLVMIVPVFFLIPLLPRGEASAKLNLSRYEKRPRIALVLSGGGAKGLAHIGVLKIIEQTGLSIDCITGTSMGSIVGGLYAVGYRAGSLEKLVLSIDWDEYLQDEVSRRSTSIDEKWDHDRYIGSFQITKSGIHLPRGYKRGQKLTALLSRLTLPIQHVTDFDQLPIPFRCIGTDVVTGKAYVMKKGYLPDAMRASMSIPTIFTPIEVDGHLLIDGGVIRNLPVSDARAMGADIVIAVDVGAPLYRKEELKSVAEIMDQSVSFLGARSTKKERLLTDILLIPDIKGFSGQDFKRARELIAVGEDAAKLILPELKELAELQKRFPEKDRGSSRIRDIKKMHVTDIEIRGLQRVSRNLVMGKLMIDPPAMVTADDIVAAVDRVFASGFFERVTFQIEPDDADNTILILNVIESSGLFLKLGFSYDSDMNAAVLLNTTFRNIAGQGSKISIDARLSQNPGIVGSYFIHTGLRRPGIGFGVKIHYDKYGIFTYKNGDIKASYDYQNTGGDLLLQTILFNSIAIGIGVQKDATFIKDQIAPNDPKKENIEALNYYAYCMFDNLDRTFYPRSGFQLYADAKFITRDLLLQKHAAYFHRFFKYMLKMKGFIPFHKRFVMFLGLSGGFTVAHETMYFRYDIPDGLTPYIRRIPFIYQNYIGGLNTYNKDYFPFTGLNFMQISGKQAIVADAGFQIEFWPDMFIILRGSLARVKDRVQDLFRKRNMVIESFYGYKVPRYQDLKNDLIYGYGLTIGINTIIGPVEATLMQGSESNRFLFHVNIGYRF